MRVITLRGITVILLLFSSAICAWCAPLANEDLDGLYARSIEQVLRLEPEEIDIGTAALIVSEEWSQMVHGRRYQRELDEMAYEIQAIVHEKNLAGHYKAVSVINDYLFNELGFTAVKEATDPNDLFLHSVIDNRRGYCLSLSILYLSLGERLGLPLYGVVVPGHFFVRYDDGRVRFNIETTSGGGFTDDEHYIREFNVPLEDTSNIYMQSLNKLQTLGCFFNNLGNVYSGAGKIDAAAKALELATEINPDLAEAHTNLGNIYLHKGRIDDAIYEYRRALEINPADGKTYNNLGNAYAKKGWTNDAMGAYEEALRLDANQVDAYINLAVTYGQIEMYAKAQLMLKEAAAIEPGRAEIYVKRGDMYFREGEYEDALSQYKFALSVERNNASAHFGMGLCYGKLGMSKNEILSYQQALKSKPDLFAARANLGNVYFRQKDYTKAIKHYRMCIDIDPNSAVIYYNVGAAFSNLGKYVDAVPWYQQALQLEPEMADAHYNLGFAYYKLENYPAAYKHLTIARRSGTEVDAELIKAVEKKIR